MHAFESVFLLIIYWASNLDLIAPVASPAQDSLGDILSLPNAKADAEPLKDQAG